MCVSAKCEVSCVKMSMSFYLILFDLETTSLNTKQGRFVQFGSVVYEIEIAEDGSLLNCVMATAGKEEKAEFEQNCHSGSVKMCPISIKVTGITQEMVDAQPLSGADVLQNWRQFIHKFCSKQTMDKKPFARVLSGWNVENFDLPFVSYEACRLPEGGVQYFKSLVLTSLMDFLLTIRDTPALFHKMPHNKYGSSTFKLGDVYRILTQKALVDAHSALADSVAVMDVIKAAAPELKAVFKAMPICQPAPGVSNIMTTVSKCAMDYRATNEQSTTSRNGLLDIFQNYKRAKTDPTTDR